MPVRWDKCFVTSVLAGCWLAGVQVGYCDDGGTIWEHILYIVSHGSMLHLAGNLFVLWVLRGRLWLWQAVMVAVVMSFVPSLPGVWDAFCPDGKSSGTVTMGFSGVLFAIIGAKWGEAVQRSSGERRAAAWRAFVTKVMPFVLAGAFIPHVNWSLHACCLGGGLLTGRCFHYGR